MTSDRGEWFILRTSGPSTLAVAASLAKAGIDAWTPQMVAKRRRPRSTVVVERDAAILPTFVFVRAAHLPDLFRIVRQPVSPHPAFSIFVHAGRVPMIGEATLRGLRQEEADAAAALQDERDAVVREAARQERIALLKTEKAKRKALRAERRDFRPGADVSVKGAAAFAGMAGKVVTSNGTSAVVAFGGRLTLTIEAWQLVPIDVEARSTSAGTPALAAS